MLQQLVISIAIDGKTVRRSFDKNKKQGAIHMAGQDHEKDLYDNRLRPISI